MVTHCGKRRYTLAAGRQGDAQSWLHQQGLLHEMALQTAQAEGEYFHLLGWQQGRLALAFWSAAERPAIDAPAVVAAFSEPPLMLPDALHYWQEGSGEVRHVEKRFAAVLASEKIRS
ncbi:hypothetical protein ERHA55_52530 (plasmid) [Erwinia rhapontici]|nr:hypothetical protein ERHA55_52530 [Erwinia rhapontici]